ncbi:hypothetical protein BLA60_19025 [Actinophytocola xinjiangensis]|uniref:Uncharacterized protein n=1 Tax=Actinophytocola xinjiangensis TaxID=485602 RepID=A0A7Z1AYJ2_9PSEU|nr:hypothetical protein [Actinophytocola xinjiangensis]OLF09283.1 hypothetical protein BLA60_19025 [Actinophytocola xinjiangensis]
MRAVVAVAVGLALLALAPLLGRGFVLTYDMVFTARQWLTPEAVGLSTALPRSVPADAVVALLTTVLPGDVVQQLILAAALVAGPVGAARLVPTGSLGVRLVAAVTYGWSTYVAERLFIGHWPYVVAYACLPWIAHAALALRELALRGAGLRPPGSSVPATADGSGGPGGPSGTVSASRPALSSPTGPVVHSFADPAPEPPADDEAPTDLSVPADEPRSPGPDAAPPPNRSGSSAGRGAGEVAAEAGAGGGHDGRRRWWRGVAVLVVASAPAVITPSGGLMAAAVAVVCGGWRRLWITGPLVVVLNAPWWVPALAHPGGGLSAVEGAGAFGARAENWGGDVVSLLGLGGIWNAEAVPDSRGNPLVPVITVIIVAVAALGWWRWRRSGPAAARLVALGVLGVGLGAVGGTAAVEWLVATVPGGGLLRDSQKWVVWWALPLSVGFALGVGAAASTLRRGRRGLLVAAAVLPVVVMPDLAWGGWGRLQAVEYPRDWQTVARTLADDPRGGDVVALPWSAFRQFGWNGHRTQLDPAPRVLPRPTVVDDTLYVDGKAVAGEDRRAADVAAAIARGDDLGALGIGWVLVEHGTPGPPTDDVTDGMERVHQGEWLDLYRVPGDIAEVRGATPPAGPVVAADVIALATVTLSLLWLVLPAGRLTPSRPRKRK